jgi:alkyl hydroperoxide reductase subunit D
MESHEHAVREHGLTTEQVQSVVRIAAVVHSVAAVLDGEAIGAVEVLRAA